MISVFVRRFCGWEICRERGAEGGRLEKSEIGRGFIKECIGTRSGFFDAFLGSGEGDGKGE